ncbi:hypothetical protein V8E53_007857 [Lactarius tabidus]
MFPSLQEFCASLVTWLAGCVVGGRTLRLPPNPLSVVICLERLGHKPMAITNRRWRNRWLEPPSFCITLVD